MYTRERVCVPGSSAGPCERIWTRAHRSGYKSGRLRKPSPMETAAPPTERFGHWLLSACVYGGPPHRLSGAVVWRTTTTSSSDAPAPRRSSSTFFWSFAKDLLVAATANCIFNCYLCYLFASHCLCRIPQYPHKLIINLGKSNRSYFQNTWLFLKKSRLRASFSRLFSTFRVQSLSTPPPRASSTRAPSRTLSGRDPACGCTRRPSSCLRRSPAS
jgi:hypothetical protein